MAPTVAELFASPDHYLHAFDGGDAVFVAMDRAAYRRSIFLDGRISQAGPATWRVPIASLLAEMPEPQPLAWIFHVAHCGSTLLARAIDELGGGLVLREPLALRQVALAPDPARLQLVLAMLSRRYPGDGRTLVKANVPANFILTELAASNPQTPAILLHLGLCDYLLAILRSDNHRGWLHQITGLLAAHLDPFDPANDGERAAALWLAQTERFSATLFIMPEAMACDGERFLSEPTSFLHQAVSILGVRADTRRIASVADGAMFSTYSKRPDIPFDNFARQTRRTALQQTLAPELAAAGAWLARARNGTVSASALGDASV